MKKPVIVILSILVGMLIVWFCCRSSDNYRIEEKEKTVLHFGTCADYPPMEYYRDGTLTGFEIELAKCIAEKLGKEITFEDMGFSALKIALEKGFIDAFTAAFGVTSEGREKFDFTIPYYVEGLVFLHKKSDPITSFEELSQRKIIYQLSNQIKKALEENMPRAELISTDRMDMAVEMLKAGHGDCVCIDVFVANAYCEKSPELTYFVLDNFKVSEGIAIALPKGSPLKGKIDEVLKELEFSGTLQALRKKWKLEAEWKLPDE
ncbi:MAG: ABC transporter substrate-binding protein [Puniceicoccales bacterium]|jgi:polar amino acid transport system substrate-binding protein|nr:ABC transporter substrate-binding protein [Puniceicoccales bacterium]